MKVLKPRAHHVLGQFSFQSCSRTSVSLLGAYYRQRTRHSASLRDESRQQHTLYAKLALHNPYIASPARHYHDHRHRHRHCQPTSHSIKVHRVQSCCIGCAMCSFVSLTALFCSCCVCKFMRCTFEIQALPAADVGRRSRVSCCPHHPTPGTRSISLPRTL